ncbi:hypothetical protein FJU08_22165 [Martelella alba]|uniref:Uncharacterized protein n=1 Tax=Martelella alba TaxID=2590451 RepID=A0A506TZV5_9HYPH|nr:hypothetical protein FJU08_22165 [Martelella alba]
MWATMIHACDEPMDLSTPFASLRHGQGPLDAPSTRQGVEAFRSVQALDDPNGSVANIPDG